MRRQKKPKHAAVLSEIERVRCLAFDIVISNVPTRFLPTRLRLCSPRKRLALLLGSHAVASLPRWPIDLRSIRTLPPLVCSSTTCLVAFRLTMQRSLHYRYAVRPVRCQLTSLPYQQDVNEALSLLGPPAASRYRTHSSV